MMDEQPTHQPSGEDVRTRRVEAFVARLAILFQAAAVVWLAYLWHRKGPRFPGFSEEALWAFSWLTMISATLVVVAIARRWQDLRLGPILCILLWGLLGLLLILMT